MARPDYVPGGVNPEPPREILPLYIIVPDSNTEYVVPVSPSSGTSLCIA